MDAADTIRWALIPGFPPVFLFETATFRRNGTNDVEQAHNNAALFRADALFTSILPLKRSHSQLTVLPPYVSQDERCTRDPFREEGEADTESRHTCAAMPSCAMMLAEVSVNKPC